MFEKLKFWKKEQKKEFRKGPALACVNFGVCSKEACPMWIFMDDHYKNDNGEDMVNQIGKCSFAWIPQLMIETRYAISRLEVKDVVKEGSPIADTGNRQVGTG